MKHHNRYEAKKYAPRVPPEQRVKAFVLVGCVLGGHPGDTGGHWEVALHSWDVAVHSKSEDLGG